MREDFVVVVLSMIILSGVGLMIAAMVNRYKIREMEHRGRLAMIERGLMPSPEVDPGRFEAAAGFRSAPERPEGVRYRTAGVLMIGLGLAVLILITFSAREPATALGIGGGFAALGAASLLNYRLITERARDRHDHLRWTNSDKPAQPPSQGAP